MVKLFNEKQGTEPLVRIEEGEQPHDALPQIVGEYNQSIDMTLEASQMAVEHMQLVQGMHDNLISQKLCSTAYLHTLEAYSPLVKSMGARMGVKSFPSLESFSNRYAAQDAHNYAVEGFKEMLSKIWQRIKDFFRELFKKVKLFVKRLTGANLELDNYEKYCEQLIGKLKTNNAVIADNSALISELPRLLCDANGAPVDSDFVLNQGNVKIKNLLKQMEAIKYGSASTKLHKDVADFRTLLETYIAVVSSKDGVSQEDFRSATKGVQDQGLSLLNAVFPYDNVNLEGLSPKVSEEISNRFAGRVKDTDLTYKSMVQDLNGCNNMPTGINMYLVTSRNEVDNEPSLPCVFIGTQHTVNVNKNLTPIGNLNNLVKFHGDYKNTLGKFDDKSTQKSVDALSSEVDKLLNLLQQKFPTLVQATTPVPTETTCLAGLVNLVNKAKQKHSDKLDSLMDSTCRAAVLSYGSGVDDNAVLVLAITEFFDAHKTKDDTLKANAFNAVKSQGSQADPFIQRAIEYLLTVTNSAIGEITQEEMTERSKAVSSLQNLLTHIFIQLQTLYRGMMVEFYKVYTELRYAVIKYIYDSAKRYTY